jgi:hypothetical protein
MAETPKTGKASEPASARVALGKVRDSARVALGHVMDSARVSLTVRMTAKEAVSRLIDLTSREDSAVVHLAGTSERVASVLTSLRGRNLVASARVSLAGRTPVGGLSADSVRASLSGRTGQE